MNKIYNLNRGSVDAPTLPSPPSSWVLSLLHTDAAAGFNGPGRIAFDSRGNIWVTENFSPPGDSPGRWVTSLDPNGNPRNGGEVSGGGILGSWWGIAIDHRDRVWTSNYTGDDPNEFTSPAFVGGKATSLFTSNGKAISPAIGFRQGGLQGPQGIAVDQQDNVWIANHTKGTVTEYIRGRPGNSRVITGGGLYNPFSVSVDADGNVWVDNGALDATFSGTMTKITPDGVAHGPYPLDVHSPQGNAVDFEGNIWASSLVNSNVTRMAPDGSIDGHFTAPSIGGGWGLAIDGDDNVWVAGFINQSVTELCGTAGNCPKGTATGDPISPADVGFTNGGMQHITAVQVDQSGNVWAANNWASISPIVGGNGLVELVGAAAPVATPLIGAPERPANGA